MRFHRLFSLMLLVLVLVFPLAALALDATPTTGSLEGDVHAIPVTPAPAATPIVEGDFNAAGQLVLPLVKAIEDGNYFLAFALAAVFATFIVRTYFWKSIPTQWIPVVMPVSVGVTVLAAGLQVGAEPLSAFMAGLQAGFAAVGVNQAWLPIRAKLAKRKAAKKAAAKLGGPGLQ